MNGEQAAQVLGWSPSWVSRLMSGKRSASEVDVAAIRLPTKLVTLINHENRAVTYSDIQPMVVPGLLQTGDYARAVLSCIANVPAEEVDDRVTARLARRSLFSRERPARFTFYLRESVLRTLVGGPAVVSEQLHHLLRMAVRPYLTLRVIPATLGAHAASDGPFTLLEFAELRPVVYLESATSSLFLEEREEITAYRLILGALARTTMGERESRELIAPWQPSSTPTKRTTMSVPDPNGIVWHTSSYNSEGDCVEVAPGGVAVRDSKNADGPALAVTTTAWHAFLTTVTR